VDFNACTSVGSNIQSYKWEIQGESIVRNSCKFNYDKLRFLGTYTVKLTVTAADGQTSSTQQEINVKDILIVSVGDSFASGQGNPDIERNDQRSAVWNYLPCHRSAQAAPALAALRIEHADPHSSVTFISYACSGATIRKGLIGEQRKGLVDLAPQIRNVRTTTAGRRIDALLVSVGGNDAQFASLIALTIGLPNAATSSITNDLFRKGLGTLESGYQAFSDQTATLFANPKVFITEYPELARDENGVFCDKQPGEDFFLKKISFSEAQWASNTVITGLNLEVKKAAMKHNWIYVGDIATRTLKHGYCAGEQRWVRTFDDAKKMQGSTNCLKVSLQDCLISSGSMHPNGHAHACIATQLVHAMQTNGVFPFAVGVAPDDPCPVN
jgi:hypothetical protein